MLMVVSTAAKAEGGLDARDYAAQADLRGYTTYHQLSNDNHAQTPNMGRNVMTVNPDAPMMHDRLYLNQAQRIPRANEITKQKPSKLEKFYRERTNDKTLSQFGYDLFYTPQSDISGMNSDDNTTPMGAVQGDYVLQSGDTLSVIFSGENRNRETVIIASDGRLIIDGLPPITAMGRTLNAVRADIESILNNQNYRGDIDISVSAIRQIGVLVAGQVLKPGRHNLNAFHSVLDALNIAGGVRPNGSLRSVKLIRSGKIEVIDLYDVIAGKNTIGEMTLIDGDRVIVPPVGATFAIVGDVKQSGIYELKTHYNRTQSISLNTALSMAGNIIGGGDFKFALMHPRGNVTQISRQSKPMITDGSVVSVTRAKDRLANAIEVKGYSRQNGIYDLSRAGTLYALMGNKRIFGDDTYPLMGIISRVNRDSLTRKLMGFSPQSIAKAQDDRQLEEGDIVYLFSYKNIDEMVGDNVDAKPKIKNPESEPEFPKIVRDYILDHVVTIQGAVRNEGAWPVGTLTNLETLVSVAGGLTSRASRTNIEITSRHGNTENTHRRRKINATDLRLSEVALEAGDQVRIHERFEQVVNKTVRITGEVKNAGSYDLMRGDTLSSIIKRAGGLTLDAYAPAAVFSRKAERKREEQSWSAQFQ
jgi:polysaccharide export outer membrane protein